jgi:hypothetical protein
MASAFSVSPPQRAVPGTLPVDDLPPFGLSCAAVCLAGVCLSAAAAPATCAEVRAAIEKRPQARGAAAPELQIVPRSLARGQRVVGTCEDGTQKIVQRSAAAPSAAVGPGGAARPGSARPPSP